MSVNKFVELLISVSEKAANLAKIIRQDEHLFALLIEKKTGDEANPRFVNDFKTLADVLIQECVKYYVSKLVRTKRKKRRIVGKNNNR
jgi:inositol polyphosphate 1-phosphatase